MIHSSIDLYTSTSDLKNIFGFVGIINLSTKLGKSNID